VLMPEKEMTEREREQWEDALGEEAFQSRTAKFNGRAWSRARTITRSTAKKWRDYYSHDSGHCRIVIHDGGDYNSLDDVGKRQAKAFMDAQLFPVAELVSQRSCKHETATVTEERRDVFVRWEEMPEEDDPYPRVGSHRRITELHTFQTFVCPRCGLAEEIDVTEEAVAAVA